MDKRVFRVLLIISALSFLGTLILYPSMPGLVPTNWGFDGTVSAWGPKSMNLFLASLPFLITLGLRFLPNADPRKKNYAKHAKAYSIISAITVVALMGLAWAIILPSLGSKLPVEKTIMLLVGLMLVGMGNFMPQVRSNFFMGFRTPWALSDETVWRKTHRAGGIVFCVSGILMVLSVFFPGNWVPFGVLILLLAGCAGVCVYSYVLYRKLPR